MIKEIPEQLAAEVMGFLEQPMEKATHAAPYALRDRLCENSDSTPVAFCKKCGTIAEHAHSSRFGRGTHADKPHCRACGTNDAVVLQIPFASNLLLRELQALHISAKVDIGAKY